MLDMARKKKPDTPTPAPGGETKSQDQHKSNRLVRLPVAWHEALKEAARKANRPVTWELREALRKHLQEQGIEIPEEESDTST